MATSDETAAGWQAVKRVLIIEMALNILVASAKGGFGIATGSLAITADAVHSVIDAAANVLALIAVRMASAPPDREHPYGHRKFEIVAAAGIGVAVGVAAVQFAWNSVTSLLHGPAKVEATALGFAVIIGTWVVNIFVALYEARRGRELGSELLIADAAHTASDVFVTAAVLASYAGAYVGISWADPVGALVVVVVIGRVAWHVLATNLSVLVDQATVDAERVHALACSVEGVDDCHRVRSHGTRRAAQVDLHIQVDGDLSVRRAHEIAHDVERVLRAEMSEIADVTVHMEPLGDAPETL